jgi:hypothetical protein
MRHKASPRKRGRPAEGPGAADSDAIGAAEREQRAQNVAEPALPSARRRKRPRVGEPQLVKSVCTSAQDADLLGFADVLLCAPSDAPTPCDRGGADLELRLAPGLSDRLLLSWGTAAFAPQVPVRGSVVRLWRTRG